jgi:cysteine synthase
MKSDPSVAKKCGARIAGSVLDLLFHTPIVRLQRVGREAGVEIFAKLEALSPGGSVKDRVTLNMIETAEREGRLGPGAVVVEPTSGNTGIGLALVCAVKGYRCIIVMPEDMSLERVHLLRNLGAEVILTPARETMAGAIRKANEIAGKTPGAFLPGQYANAANPEIHRLTTAREIVAALEADATVPDAFVAGVGTGGTITGVGQVLRERYPGVRIFAVEPERSAVLSGGKPGQHRIQGIGAGFVPEVLDRSVFDEVITVSDNDAFETCRRLIREEAIICGISSGANCWAALSAAARMGGSRRIVTVLPDTGERYFSVHQYFEL